MKCNNCGNEMIVGQSNLSASFGGFLVFGLSYKHLMFRSENFPSKVVLGNNDAKTAYYCDNCGSVFIKNSTIQGKKKVGKYTYEIQDGDDLSKIVP